MRKSVQELKLGMQGLEDRSFAASENLSILATQVDRSAEVSRTIGSEVKSQRTNQEDISAALETLNGKVDSLAQRVAVSRNEVIHETKQTAMDSVANIEALMQIMQPANDGPSLPSTGGWALSAKSILQLIELIRTNRPKRVLELGGGTSTVWLGKELQRYAGHLYSVDHDEVFFQQTVSQVSAHRISDQVTPILAPLTSSKSPEDTSIWYDAKFVESLPKIDMLVIDGPPGNSSKLARLPALYKLRNYLSPGAIVALDDADRPDELLAIDAWSADFGLIEIGLPFGRFRVFQIPNPAR